jgi:glucan biosynthesis protein C
MAESRPQMEKDQERIHYLDWLKVLIVYGIVVFHVSLVFAYGSWLISNTERDIILSAFAGFTFPWGIPAMFLIAGADAWFGLRSHTLVQFVRGRFMRLLVPMVPGLLLISPLQRFVASHNPPPPLEGLPAFYLAFFRDFHFDWTLQWVSRYWLHLWFLGYLFVISLACAPLLIWLRRPGGRRLTSALLAVANRRGGLMLLAAPLCLTQLVLRPGYSAFQDWADVATYTLAFVWGAILFSDRRFELAIRRQIRLILLSGVAGAATVGLLILLNASFLTADAGAKVAVQAAFAVAWSLDIWSWLLAVLYLGIRWLDFENRAQRYARESIMPVYVIHHPVVLVVSSFVVTWSIGVWPKFVVVLMLVFGLTLGIYEFGVRRWPLMRVLFGLSASQRPPERDGGYGQPDSRRVVRA